MDGVKGREELISVIILFTKKKNIYADVWYWVWDRLMGTMRFFWFAMTC